MFAAALATLGFAPPALAHGEEALAFPCSTVLVLAVVVPLTIFWPAPWKKKLLLGALVVAANLAMWFAPWLPHNMLELAAYDDTKLMAWLLAPPAVVGLAIVMRAIRAARDHTKQS